MSETRADGLPGPVRPRRPEDFDSLYSGTPAWDIGRPQPAFMELAEAGALRGNVLDVGCGTGEHALLAASLGLTATGIDAAAAAIAIAERKAQDRGLTARFLVWNALELASLDDRFDTVLDCGLFISLTTPTAPNSLTVSKPRSHPAAAITCSVSVSTSLATGGRGG